MEKLKIEEQVIGSCNCANKTPKFEDHDELCYFRLLMERTEPVAKSPAAMAGSISKPPIGLKPRWVNDVERGIEISQACMRYIAERKEIPSEWLQELEEISSRIEK